MKYAAIDTGTTRNATVLVLGESRITTEHPEDRPLWVITGLWRWQGRPGKPLDHRCIVGPFVYDLLAEKGISVLAADGIEKAGLELAFAAKSEERTKARLPAFDVRLRIQGGELGPSPDGSSIGVYGHGKVVVQERRLKIEIEDTDEIDRLVRGLQAIQEERGKVWLPEEGTDHHDSTSAVLRLLWHAGAGIIRSNVDYGADNSSMPSWGVDAIDTREEFA